MTQDIASTETFLTSIVAEKIDLTVSFFDYQLIADQPVLLSALMGVFFGCVLLFSLSRLLFLSSFFQQEDYDAKRFFKRLFVKLSLIDKRLISLLIIGVVSLSFLDLGDYARHVYYGVLSLLFIVITVRDVHLFKTMKKRAVVTQRLRRISIASYIIAALVFIPIWGMVAVDGVINAQIIALIIFIQILPLCMIVGNALLWPYETIIQRRFRNEAIAKLGSLNPDVIGITGSYGKTSVKHILAHVLNQVTPTLATPGSVNTVMGITRVIREKLGQHHKFFIAEMGAYGIGSIKRLCDFCPPNHGILTAVGNAHYERFKSVENVAQAKFELFQAVYKEEGYFVVNADQVDEKFIKAHVTDYADKLVLVSRDKSKKIDKKTIDFVIENVETDVNGLRITIFEKETNEKHLLTVPLFGDHQINNCVAAFALCRKLGVPATTLVASFKTVPQIKHRLEVKRIDNGPDLIDDAYNSNPKGFASALDVLDLLGQAAKKKNKNARRILLTPGMVELGDLHDEKHIEIAKIALETCDEILLVRPERFQAFSDICDQMKRGYKTFPSFFEAKKWLDDNTYTDDIVLYENDLPDLYESTVCL